MSTQKSNIKTIEQMWQEYREMVYPPNKMKLSECQESECKQAFFTAIADVLKMMRDDLGELPEDDAVRELESLHEQCARYSLKRLVQLRQRN